MEGFLKIKQSLWRQYYFILTNDCLSYCEKKGEPIIGRFHLKVSTIMSVADKPLTIVINNGFTDILLEAEDVREKIKWVTSFMNRQEELRKYDNQDIYSLHNLEEIVLNDPQVPEEIREILENKFVNCLAELWNHQAIVDESLDNLTNFIKDSSRVNLLKKIEHSVATIKVNLFLIFIIFYFN